MGLREWLSLDVSLDSTISDIEQVLVEAGAGNINKVIQSGRITALMFTVDIENKRIPFKLPVNIRAVEASLRRDSRRIKPRSEEERKLADKAEVVAWKAMLNWLDAQIVMIKIEQVKFMEVFLPYVYNEQNGQTYYTTLEITKFQALPQSTKQ